MLLPLLLLVMVFWLFSRQRKQSAQQAKMRSAVQPGQRIMTTAGLFGTVLSVDGDRMKLEIAPGVVVEMVKAAVARLIDEPVDSEPYASEPLALDAEAQPSSSDVTGTTAAGHIDLDASTSDEFTKNSANATPDEAAHETVSLDKSALDSDLSERRSSSER